MGTRYSVRTIWAVLLGAALVLALGCSEEKGLKVKKLSRTSGIPGDPITIYGSGFQADGVKNVRVFFGTKKAKVLGFRGNDRLVVEAPGGIDFGKEVDLRLIFEPGGEITLPKAFKYVRPNRSTVDDLLGGKKPKE